MRALSMSIATFAAITVTVVGCSANLSDGRFTCGPGNDCPPGFACRGDGRCYRGAGDDSGSANMDAAPIDSGTDTAPIDSGTDAPSLGAVGAACGSDGDCQPGLSCYPDASMVRRCHCEPYTNIGCGSGQACYFYVYLFGPPVVLEARCHSVGAAPRGDTACTADFDDARCAPSSTCVSSGCQPLCRNAGCDAAGCHHFNATTTPTGYGWCGP